MQSLLTRSASGNDDERKSGPYIKVYFLKKPGLNNQIF